MKTKSTIKTESALTLLEVIVVIFIVVLLAGLLLPALTRPRGTPAPRINCISNLKQIGLAMRIWSNDHDDKFPWQIPAARTGTLEFAESPVVFLHFLAVQKELSSPKVLVCSTDAQRSKVTDFAQLNNEHLSYFAGLDAGESAPQSILSGDRNITGGVVATNGILRLDSQSAAGWGNDLHNNAGNLALGDGSAQQVNANSLRKQIQSALLTQTNLPVLRLAIPR